MLDITQALPILAEQLNNTGLFAYAGAALAAPPTLDQLVRGGLPAALLTLETISWQPIDPAIATELQGRGRIRIRLLATPGLPLAELAQLRNEAVAMLARQPESYGIRILAEQIPEATLLAEWQLTIEAKLHTSFS